MSRIRWIQYNELVLGENHPTEQDVDNRPLKDILTFSNTDPDADDFPGLIVRYMGGILDPNGTVVANIGNAFFSTVDGSFWMKVTGDGTNTGWTKIAGNLATILVAIGDGTNVITTGFKGVVEVPFAHTIVAARLFSSDSAITVGSIVMDIWRDTYANYPPTVADTITAAAKPTIVTGIKSENISLIGWNVAGNAGDIYGFNVDSVTAFKQILLSLTLRKG